MGKTEKIRIENGIGIIPEGTTKIGKSYSNGFFVGNYPSFENKKKLEKVIIPDTVHTIGCNTFLNCVNLKEVIIPDSVKVIDRFAFKGCKNLKEIRLSNSLETIELKAFEDCSSLSNIIIPASVKEINGTSFLGTDVEEIKVEEENPYYDSRDNCNAIIDTRKKKLIVGCRSTVIPSKVTTIGTYAFACCKSLKTIEITEDIDTIERLAFLESGLTDLFIPKNVFIIEGGITAGCHALKRIIVDKENNHYDSRYDCNAIIKSSDNIFISACPNSKLPQDIAKIEEYALCNWGMAEIIIPETVDRIGLMAFAHNSKPFKVVLPKNIKEIPNFAFYESKGLKEIFIPEGVKSINNSAFEGCSSLSTVCFPSSLSLINKKAFCNCSKLQHLDFPDNLKKINDDTLLECSKLISVRMPLAVSELGLRVFKGCKNLKKIENPITSESLHTVFQGCSNLEEIHLGHEVTYVGENTFKDCINLQNVTMEGPQKILVDIFKDSINMKTLTLGKDIKNFGPFWGKWANNLTTIFVPVNMLSYFEKKIPKRFHSILKEKE